MMQMEQGIEQF